MIWCGNDSAHKPVPTESPDLTATLLTAEDRRILVFSAYVQHKSTSRDEELLRILSEIGKTTASTRRAVGEHLEVIVAGDLTDGILCGEGTMCQDPSGAEKGTLSSSS
jgi:hypothetical protein